MKTIQETYQSKPDIQTTHQTFKDNQETDQTYTNTEESYRIFTEGAHFQNEYIRMIRSAKNKICLHSYIFQLDTFGTKVKDALIEKAQENVAVEILVDYIGSYDLEKTTFDNIKNIKFKYFNVFSLPNFIKVGRRLHYKILIVDTKVAFIGGINIVDGTSSKTSNYPRLDFAVRIEGQLVDNLEKYCSMIFSQKKEVSPKLTDFDVRDFTSSKIKFKINDWFKGRNQITSSYYNLIKYAKTEIVLIHGYFFPSFKILRLLKKRARDGISVIIIVPQYSDWASWIWARDHLYSKLLQNNIQIFEWDLSILHGKMAIFDRSVITLGSHNLNYTSSYGNLEINVEIHDALYSSQLRGNLVEKILISSKSIDKGSYGQPIFIKIRNFIFYASLMSIAVFSIYYIKLSYQLARLSKSGRGESDPTGALRV